jgi:hypothetical protein
MSYTEKQEHILTLRISKEMHTRLRRAAEENYCSVSELARDILWSQTQGMLEGEQEHVFLYRASWAKAVKARDVFRCVWCGRQDDIEAYPISSLNLNGSGMNGENREHEYNGDSENYQNGNGGSDDEEGTWEEDEETEEDEADEHEGLFTLSNGITLCFSCYQEHNPTEAFEEHGRTIYERLPQGWMRKYHQSKEKGRLFWELHLACFLTRRKRILSPIVMWYAETFLRNVPEDVLIRTLVELCPSPDIIARFPGRQYTSPNEQFPPPPLVWR